MAYVPVPKDLNAVKTKVMFNLTKRQLICFGAGAVLGLPAFFLLKNHIGSTGAASSATGNQRTALTREESRMILLPMYSTITVPKTATDATNMTSAISMKKTLVTPMRIPIAQM